MQTAAKVKETLWNTKVTLGPDHIDLCIYTHISPENLLGRELQMYVSVVF